MSLIFYIIYNIIFYSYLWKVLKHFENSNLLNQCNLLILQTNMSL